MGVASLGEVLLDPDAVVADLDDLAGCKRALVLLLAPGVGLLLLLLLSVSRVLLLIHGLVLHGWVALRHVGRVTGLLLLLLLVMLLSVRRVPLLGMRRCRGVRQLLLGRIRWGAQRSCRPAGVVGLRRSVHGVRFEQRCAPVPGGPRWRGVDGPGRGELPAASPSSRVAFLRRALRAVCVNRRSTCVGAERVCWERGES